MPRVPYVFQRHGGWNAKEARGGAHDAPREILNSEVSEFHALWLGSYDGAESESSKNHICFYLRLARPYRDRNTLKRYYAALISMEPDEAATTDHFIHNYYKGPVCSVDFVPGIFSLKMHGYDQSYDQAISTAFSRQYPLAQEVTIEQFTESIFELAMNEFLFELYTSHRDKKGGGHFAVRAYEAWLVKGILTDPHSIEAPHRTFPQDLLYTYLPDGSSQIMPVARGTFLRDEARAFERYTYLIDCETVWMEAPTSSHLVAEGWNVDEYYARKEEADWRRWAALLVNAADDMSN